MVFRMRYTIFCQSVPSIVLSGEQEASSRKWKLEGASHLKFLPYLFDFCLLYIYVVHTNSVNSAHKLRSNMDHVSHKDTKEHG